VSLDIRPDHLEMVRAILQQYLPQAQVWAFGSRVKGTARKTSDLDLCVDNKAPLSFEALATLRDVFSESNIPYKVDVVDWQTIDDSFRAVIVADRLSLV
jgi:predicted nucleotidyltransferase